MGWPLGNPLDQWRGFLDRVHADWGKTGQRTQPRLYPLDQPRHRSHPKPLPLFCEDAIISATCLNPANHPYKGPLVREKPCGFRLAWPGDKPQTFNGNLVVIPQKAWKQLEIKSYRHAFGDLHYGLDAHQKGIPILKGPECARTSWQNPNWRDQKTFAKRLRHCLHPTGLPPSDWWKFCRHFGGPAYPLRFLVGYRYLLHKRSSPHPMVKTEPPHP